MIQFPIYNVLMKIHYLGIRGKYYNFIIFFFFFFENLYLSFKACVRVNGQLSESFNIKKKKKKKKKRVRQGFSL